MMGSILVADDEFVSNFQYVQQHERFNSRAYVDGTGVNATISLGHGFNAKFIVENKFCFLNIPSIPKIRTA